MATSRAIGRVLAVSVACWPAEHRRTRVTELATRHEGGLAGLGAAAAFHGIASYVHAALTRAHGVPPRDRTAVKALRDGNAMTHLRTMADLSYLRQTLDAAAVPWLVVKGPVLAAHHGGAGWRSYTDVDVLVPGDALPDALGALETSGSQVQDRNWTLIRDAMKGEVHLRLPTGTPLDLHWHLLNDRRSRAAFPIPIRALFDRSRHVEVDGVPLPTLGLADTVVYVALHTMLSGAHRLIWLKDLERLMATEHLPTDEIVEVARRWRAELVLASALQRVDLAIPGATTRRRLPRVSQSTRAWAGLAGLAWRMSPAQCQDGRASLARLVSRSLRGTPSESLRELVHRGQDHLREDEGSRQRHRPFTTDDPRSGRYPSGGPAARQAFLDEVARESV